MLLFCCLFCRKMYCFNARSRDYLLIFFLSISCLFFLNIELFSWNLLLFTPEQPVVNPLVTNSFANKQCIPSISQHTSCPLFLQRSVPGIRMRRGQQQKELHSNLIYCNIERRVRRGKGFVRLDNKKASLKHMYCMA